MFHVTFASLLIGELIILFLFPGTHQIIAIYNEQTISPYNRLTTLKLLPKVYEISFEFFINSYPSGWANLIHLTIGGNYGGYGDRIPALFVSGNKVQVCSSVNGDILFCAMSKSIEKNVWIKAKISQTFLYNIYNYTAEINGVTIITAQNNDARDFQNVQFYASNPWTASQPGYIRNLRVLNACPEIMAIDNEQNILANTRLATLRSMPKVYEISFEFLIKSYPSGWANLIHLTTGGNYGWYGDRIPAFFVSGSKVQVCSSVNGNDLYCAMSNSIEKDVWTKAKISQTLFNNIYNYTAEINGVTIITAQNNDARDFQNVQFYASNPWTTSQPGYIRNLQVLNACPVVSCEMITTLSASKNQQEIYIIVNMTTNSECVSYLRNVTINFYHKSLVLKRLIRNDLNADNSYVQDFGKISVINVDKLSRNIYAAYYAIFDQITFGMTNVVTAYFNWLDGCKSPVLRNKKITIPVEGSKPLVSIISPLWSYTQPNGTILQTETYQFVCETMQKRQQSPCYQRETYSGLIKFLPIQYLEVIGYDSNTKLIYGITTRNNFIAMNINARKPFVISKESCFGIIACNLSLSKN